MTRTRRLPTLAVVLVALVTACGDGDGEVEGPIVDETVATTTTTTLAPATTQAPMGVPFTAEEVLQVPGISDVVGSGTIVFAIEDGNMRTEFQTVSVPAVDGKIVCPNCAGSIVMGADVILSSETFLDPDYKGEPWYIVAGPGGATLEKVGAGFRLVEGEAFLVDNLSLIAPDSATVTSRTTTTEQSTTTVVTLPSYSEVVAAFPPGVSPCTTRADISGGEGGSYEFAGGAILDNSVENPLFCFGAQYTVIGPTVLPDGTSVPVGSFLTIDGEGNLIPISGFG